MGSYRVIYEFGGEYLGVSSLSELREFVVAKIRVFMEIGIVE